MTNYNRIFSIDIMRGLTLLLMLFANDLYINGHSVWPVHNPLNSSDFPFADWIFPMFLFISGLAVPFSFSKRISAGEDMRLISRHIFTRSLSLLIIGVLMINSARLDPELTGFGRNFWSLLMYIGIFLVWNDYRDKENRFFTVTTLRLTGIAILVFLVFKFKSGQPENDGSLVTSWWGFPGLIGWGYLVAAFLFLFFRDSLVKISVATIFFFILNILTLWLPVRLPYIINLVFGVILDGYIPFIVMSGLITGLIIRKIHETGFKKAALLLSGLGFFYIAAGFITRQLFDSSNIHLVPARALISCGISMVVFLFVYWIADFKKKISSGSFIRPAAENSLTCYLLSYFIYCLILSSGLPVLIYKHASSPLIAAAGSSLFAILMILLTALLVRMGIRLRL
jgi:heparan-alpha-glucosaminide N-acetyltransferase